MNSNIPILICIKEQSMRCPNKNFTLLPHTLEYCYKVNVIQNVTIISDSNIFKAISNAYPIHEYYLETRDDAQDELKSIYFYCRLRKYDRCILLPVTQPCRDNYLIDRILETDLSEWDVATSYCNVVDRSIFEIKDGKFAIKDIERKGTLCKGKQIADGAIYYTTLKFMENVLLSDNPNKTFWNNKTKFIVNYAPQIDVDTPEDLQIYLNYIKK